MWPEGGEEVVKYQRHEDGEWIQPISRGYRTKCCDCGLIHEFVFRVKNGRVQFRVRRHGRATAACRKGKKLPMVKRAVKKPSGSG